MSQRGIQGMALVPGRVHCPAGQSRDRRLRRDYSRLCGDYYQKVVGGKVRIWRSRSTAAGLNVVDIARLV